MKNPKVAIVMGSDSDLDIMKESVDILKKFEISYEVKVLSAHRSPELVREYVGVAKDRGIQVLIAGAGGAAHLAGVLAAHTILPVVGVPINATPLNGMDALLATVQMPAGIPVATVAVGKAGAQNAAILAAQMLALSDKELSKKLENYKKDLEAGVRKKDEKVKNI
ncbi:MAG: 5-(carboxyamino)imidazole ribonucleotide mutase [Candidatus Omnitrophica bacterium]|nr:5-(carboxyamino)imidazole ribonucleotide mutase [Candidatus Omnitrophota bacterium]